MSIPGEIAKAALKEALKDPTVKKSVAEFLDDPEIESAIDAFIDKRIIWALGKAQKGFQDARKADRLS